MSNSKIRKAITEERKLLLRDVFRLMDRDADGYLDYDEAKAAMKALGLMVKKSFVMSMIRMYDRHGENKISFDNFSYVVTEKWSNQSIKDEIRHAFTCVTAESSSGKITFEDLQQINEKTAINLTKEEMRSMINEFDINQDGYIDEAEFAEIIMANY